MGMNKYNINESALVETGGVATGMENLARYILKRCDMISKTDSFLKKFNRHRPFTAFYIQRKLLEKYSSYPIPEDCTRLEVFCGEIADAYAAISYNRYFGYTLHLPPKMFYGYSEGNEEFLENLMHELTHFVNYNQKNKGGNVYSDREEIGEKTREIVKDLLYYFQDSEMNAHLTGFYYELKNRYIIYKDEESGKIWAQKRGGYGYGISLTNLKRFSEKLGWKYMNAAIVTLRDEKIPSEKCYDFSTFPKNGNKGMKWGGYFGKGDYSNVYFAILFTLKRYGDVENSVIKLPDYGFYFGRGECKWNKGEYQTEFNDVNTQELAMKYVLLKNKIRNQFFEKWEAFNRRADKIINMWAEEEMKNKKEETLFESIVKESIQEGGNAVFSTE